VIEVASRRRNQPAPPHAVLQRLTEPDRDPARQWLRLREGERRPDVLEADPPDLVVWSSLWGDRPDARIRFEMPRDSEGYGTDLRWVLLVDEPPPDDAALARMRRRLDELINEDLRHGLGA
jgi:hypothetical protein